MPTVVPRAFAQDLSFAQIEQLWEKAGGSPSLAPTMAAIALAESGGNPQALNNNPSTGDYSVGLWQINYYGNLLSSRTQRYGPPSLLQSNPLANAKAAVDLAQGGNGLGNWTTYTSGAFRQYLGGSSGGPAAGGTGQASGGQAPVGSPPSGWPASGTPVAKLTKAQIMKIANALLNGDVTSAQVNSWYPGANAHGNTWGTGLGIPADIRSVGGLISFVTSWRFAEIVGGFVLLVVGLILLGRQFGVSAPGAAAVASRVPGA